MTRQILLLALGILTTVDTLAEPAETGISGVYEVMTGVTDTAATVQYFEQFGFRTVAEATLTAAEAQIRYGVNSALRSTRMQNGDIDTHGLLRILEWEEPVGPGVGYAPPETIGIRMAVARTRDIFRLEDIFNDARSSGEPWFFTPPVYDDLYGMTDGALGIVNRRVGVREAAAYGAGFSHVFYQRYGYVIPGYGTIGDHSPLQTSEFTHHDFIIRGDIAEVTDYYETVLGFRSEAEPELDGDWRAGPQAVFHMPTGASHMYRGFVSPNNICGKLKFFAPTYPVHDGSDRVRPGALGITLHSLYTGRLAKVHGLAVDAGLEPTAILENEFGEASFVFTGPDGATWQVLAASGQGTPVLELDFQRVDN
ncbi:MAG: hypothetical protein AAGE01_11150 [Pseudomonadota bacterium]